MSRAGRGAAAGRQGSPCENSSPLTRLTCWTRSPISTLRSRQRRRRSSSSGVGGLIIAQTRGSPRLYASSARTNTSPWRGIPGTPDNPRRSPAVAEEDVIGGIGDAEKGTGSIARALGAPAASVDALHSGGVCEAHRFRAGSQPPALARECRLPSRREHCRPPCRSRRCRPYAPRSGRRSAVRPSCHRGEASRSVRGTPRRGCRRCQPCIHRSAHPQHGVSQPWPRPVRQSLAASVLWRRGPGMRPLKSVKSVSAVAALSILSLVGPCLPTCFARSLANISQAKATSGIDLSPDARATPRILLGPARPNASALGGVHRQPLSARWGPSPP